MQSATVAIAVILAASTTLTGCGSNKDEECAIAYERAVLRVDAVVSAEFECGGGFGAETQGGDVALAVDTQDEAIPVIEDVYRALAADPELTRAPYVSFLSDNGKVLNNYDLGFGGEPSLEQLREKYGITPSPTSSTS
jgi:predicted component of type VI protein secretion system